MRIEIDAIEGIDVIEGVACFFYIIYYYFMVQRYGEKIDIIETARGCGQSDRGGWNGIDWIEWDRLDRGERWVSAFGEEREA